MELTDVLFRTWKPPHRGIIALFPGEACSISDPALCLSYEHVGQHAAADYHRCIAATRPARRAEYRSLAGELRGRGYRLRTLKRASARHYQQRLATIRRLREGNDHA